MVGNGKGQLRPADLAAGDPEPLEGLGTRHLVDEVSVDIEKGGSVLFCDHMVFPDFVDDGPWHGILLDVTGRMSPPEGRGVSFVRILGRQASLAIHSSSVENVVQ